MNCNVIKDLLPLYIDKCCSEESEALVRTHLEGCALCRSDYEKMKKSFRAQPVQQPTVNLRPIRPLTASVLQSVMLFLSFAVLAVGVFLEGNTPSGESNGLWAVALIVPASGYLLSMANWYFLRSYKTRKRFSTGSFLVNLLLTAAGYGFAWVHWGYFEGGITLSSPLILVGLILSAVFCVLSKALSNQYALLLGRE